MPPTQALRPRFSSFAALALAACILLVASSGSAATSTVAVTTLTPTNGQTVSGLITWEAATNGSSIDHIDFVLDGALKWRESYSPFRYNGDNGRLDTRTLNDGSHTLSVVGYDRKGHRTTSTVTVKVANAALPVLTLSSPANGATLSGVATWVAAVSGGAVSNVDFLVDGTLKWRELYAPYGYGGAPGQFDTRTLTNGTHTLKNVAYTPDGRTVSVSVPVTVSNGGSTTPPPPTATPPSSTAAPTTTGTATVGGTLTSSTGSWSGSTPMTYATQWERCASGSSCAAISGATSSAYTVSSSDVGSTLRVRVTATNSAGSGSSSSSQSSVVPTASTTPPSTSPSSRSFTGWDSSLRPSFTATRTVVVTSQSAFTAAWGDLQAGDKIDVRGVSFSGQVALNNKQLSNWAEVHFDDATRFLGGGARGLNGVWVANLTKVRLYGGDVTNPTGHSFRIEDSTDFSWWGFKSHDAAGGCGSAFGITKASDRLDLRGEIWNCGNDLSLDPHAEKGTGLHGLYLSGGNYRTSGTFIVKVHDVGVGAAIQIGPRLQDSVIEIDARRITKVATQQVAGNALQWWGGDIRNVKVRYAYGEDLAGRMSETDALSTSNPAGTILVEYARSGGTVRLSPKYATHAAVSCQDCS